MAIYIKNIKDDRFYNCELKDFSFVSGTPTEMPRVTKNAEASNAMSQVSLKM